MFYFYHHDLQMYLLKNKEIVKLSLPDRIRALFIGHLIVTTHLPCDSLVFTRASRGKHEGITSGSSKKASGKTVIRNIDGSLLILIF
ncbi:MAG: hypothetical protein CVU48_03270 [Candidatus Cloacimonetes bacterium HGW-Cloacimonetes-1]|nr:MAG: hypothetical protein CVU48_03270 [Candidatus Cloacimonetes bacterium HGW-Cloacimonetes-1]